MKKVGKSALALFLATTLCMGTFAGCSKSQEGSKAVTEKSEDGIKFPLKEPVKLTYWHEFSSTVLKSMSDSELYKELEKRTGIKIEFIHPPEGQGKEQLNLIIASRELPDIIEGGLGQYSGGAAKAFEDGVIVDLKDLQEKYAPNLTAIYNAYPDLLVDLQTEKGNILHVPFMRGHETLLTFSGPVMRRDWLKELGLKEPATIDEWYTVLKAFKEKKGVAAPMTGILSDLKNATFVGGFNTLNDFYLENGKVVFGPITPNFKNYVSTISKWYKEGLIDSEIATNNAKMVDARITNGQSGAMPLGYVGSTVGRFLGLMEAKDPKFDFVGIQYPVQKAGDIPFYVQTDKVLNTGAGSASITTSSKYQKEAMAFLDYGFSKEGHMLYNFGIEGVSYKMENGYPKYTEVITKNPEGLPFATIGPKYIRSSFNGPFAQDPRYLEQYYTLKQHKESYTTWSKYQKNYIESNTRLRGTLTADENSRIASIMSEVNTYKDEMYLKWLMGQESIDKYDAYVQQIKKMGIDEVIKIRQAAYDRFVKQYPNAAKPKSFNVNDFYMK